MKKVLIALLLGVLFLCVSCAPRAFVPQEQLIIEFDKTPPFELDLSKIPKPEKIKPIFVDENFKEVPVDQAKYILLSGQEYAKIAALLKLAKAYKGTAEELEKLVNVRIDIENSLKELLAFEQAKAVKYRELWADSENAYRQEKYMHSLDNAINRGALGAISIGALLMLLLIL